MAPTIWIALDPVPTTPTRFPAIATPWSQRALWKHGPAKLVDARDVRIRRMVQHPGRGDDEVRLVGRSVGELEPPAAALEGAAGHLAAVADERVDPPAPRDVLEVREDLRPRREAMAPLGIERERVAVEVRRHVAGQAGIRVLAPGPAETVGLLVDDDVVVARLAELDGGEDAGHAGPDDGEAHSPTSARIGVPFTRSTLMIAPRAPDARRS